MIPLRDTLPSKRKPAITLLLILANVLIFFYQISMTDRQSAAFVYTFGFIPQVFGSVVAKLPFSFPYLLPLLSSIFLHGGLFHLISNMWVLWIFGDNVEGSMGHGRFLVFYLICGILANLTQYAFGPGSGIPTIGASGAIAGIMGAYFLLFPTARITTLIPLGFIPLFIRIPAVIFLPIWFLTQLYSGTVQTLADGRVSSGVAWWAHVGGFVGGALLHWLFLNRHRSSRYSREWD
ncbi:MAG TPA: rhomboid family intramembrane serine protease [Clostridiales bacterium]|nr:rhomboid family intramembrane serine protease [Clostridiales bacterium]